MKRAAAERRAGQARLRPGRGAEQAEARVPQSALDDAEALYRTKQAEYDSALQNARNMAADIDASSAAAKLAERQLRDASIRAPFDGYIQQRIVSLGELVKAQTPVMRVVRIDPLKVTAEIPEALAPWVKGGQPVDLQVDAYPDKGFTGQVSRISPAVNQQTRAFPFEALVPNAEGLLKPGTFVRVKLKTARVEQLLTAALRRAAGTATA